MSVRTALVDGTTATLYDSVTGLTFGPTFGSELDAGLFLEHLRDIGERDPREIRAIDLAALKVEWENDVDA